MKKVIYLLILSIVSPITLASCEKEIVEIPIELPSIPEDELITIPVVIHVLNYSPDPFEISDAKIRTQIDVLNKDFRKLNPDHLNTPDEFKHLVADIGIQFKLATVDPNGNATTGIIRTAGTIVATNGQEEMGPVEDRTLYFTDKGGQDAWPNDSYLNIWIADASNRHGDLALPGYANPPGSDPRIDGVVIDPRVFGTLEPLAQNHHLGRTATHEIGHWLNLKHIYAGQNNCNSSDLVADTPTQYASYSGRPTHPQTSCGSNDMFMNFMDYVADDAMYMFTKGQKERMRALFLEGGLRRTLYLAQKSD